MDERELSLRCAERDPRAWAELHRRYSGALERLVRRRACGAEADDVRQEVWLRLIANDGAVLRRFRGERPGALGGLLRAMARAAAADRARAAGHPAELLPGLFADPGEGPEQRASRAEQSGRLRAALDAIAAGSSHPARDRDLLRLHFEEGFSVAELARMGFPLSPRALESVVRRARDRLLGRRGDDPAPLEASG